MKTNSLCKCLLVICFVVLPCLVAAQENESKVKRFSRSFGSKQESRTEKKVSPPVAKTDTSQNVIPKIEVRVDTTRRTQMTETQISRAVEEGIRRALKQYGIDSVGSPLPTVTQSGMLGSRVSAMYDRYMEKQQMRGRHLQRVDREVMKTVFIPKGQWMVGGTINFSEWDTDNYNLTVLKNVAIEGHTFSGSPYFGYFVANNLAVGARYDYSRNYFFLENLDLNLGEDFNISLEDIYYLGHTHTADVFMRPYLPLGKSNVYGAFVDIRAGYAHTTSKNSTGRDTEYDGSFTHANTIQLKVCPGMAVFATDFLAVEASIGIMGLKYRWVNQKTNQVEQGRSRSGGANFKFNFLSANIGLTFYL